jgi:hypothetical protein
MVQAGGGEGAIFTQSVQGQRLHVWSSSSLSLRLTALPTPARDTRNNICYTKRETMSATRNNTSKRCTKLRQLKVNTKHFSQEYKERHQLGVQEIIRYGYTKKRIQETIANRLTLNNVN